MNSNHTSLLFASLGLAATLACPASTWAQDSKKVEPEGGVAGSTCSCTADVNNDGIVNAADLGIVLGAWGTSNPLADFNSSGIVDAADLSIALGAWGPCPSAPNDTCSNAEPLELGANPFCTSLATTTPGFSLSGCGQAGTAFNDIWYEFTPEGDGTLTLSTCGNVEFDSVIAAYKAILPGMGACPSPDGQVGLVSLIGCNDDGPNCGTASKLEIDVLAGFSYRIRLGGFFPGDKGSGVLTATFQSVGNYCFTAIPTNENQTHIEVSGTTADNLIGLAAECGTNPQPSPSEWISWVCPCNEALVTVSTCHPNTAFDTVVEVWRDGQNGCTSVLEACDDDSGCGLTSEASFYANFGEVFFIRVTGYSGSAAGSYVLTLDRECLP